MKFKYYRLLLLLSLALTGSVFLLSSCDHKLELPDYWPTREWRTVTPESQGFDSDILAEALTLVQQKQLPLHSLLIARRGYLVVDEYFYPFADGVRHDIASVTKSITATLVGIAIDEGHISRLDVSVLKTFANRTVQHQDNRKRQITIGHLLSMSSGFDCGYQAGEKELFAMRQSSDWIQFTLDLPMRSGPGTEFGYCSSGTHLLSAIVTQATGQSLEAYATDRLFHPLGIRDWYWPRDAAGNSHGWGDLQLYPRDMAKIGLLYLYHGQWDGRQIISSRWIKEATRRHIRTPYKGVNYGYGWWLSEIAGMTLIEADGRGGQRIVIWPEKEIVVVLTAGGLKTDELAQYLARAVRADKSLSENPEARERLRTITTALKTPPPVHAVPNPPSTAKRISGHWYQLPANPLGLEALMLDVRDKDMRLGIVFDGQRYTMPVGLDGTYQFAAQTPSKLPAGIKGRWSGTDTFVLEYNEIGGINTFTFTVQFHEDTVDVNVDEATGLYSQTLTGRMFE